MKNETTAPRVILAAGLVAGAAAVLFWASRPVPTLINWIPDDSFYYFQPASLMARGYVPSFDGLSAGNGFHPLWMLVLVPIFALKTVSASLPVHLALILAGAFYLGTAALIYKLLRLWEIDDIFAAYAAATFVLWPSGLTTIVDGEVTPVNLFILAWLLWLYSRLLSREGATARDALGLGLVGGLAVLARLDNAIFLILLAAFYVTRRRAENKWATLGLAAAPAVVLTTAWLLWNYSFSGVFLPTSSWAVPLMTHAARGPENAGPAANLAFSLNNLAAYIPYFFSYSPLKIGAAVVYGFVGAWALRATPRLKTNLTVLFLLLLFVATLYAINAGLRWYVRVWHLGAAFLANQLFLWTGLWFVAEKAKRPRLVAHIAAAAFLIFFVADAVYTARTPYFPWQHEMLAGGAWAREHPADRIGAFNAGILAYYGAGNVVDLDGNMDVAAFRALEDRRLYEYARSQRIDYIVDYDKTVLQDYRPLWPEDRVGRIKVVSRELDDAGVTSPCGDYYTIFAVK